jgi:hypothetical protein
VRLDISLRSNRAFCEAAGHYACHLFIGPTLQIDLEWIERKYCHAAWQGTQKSDVTRDLLSAKTFEDIIELSGGLYSSPDQCRMR